ncbi:MAG TPA: hypothetical protein VGY99_24350 [Candidatus Binataceae bacterium]|jgi:hypothetical protein|nr:hypothetical protein [Candidatus Binataceae bacterium]
MRTLKASAIYFVSVFAVGWVVGPIRELWVVPHLGRIAGLLFEAPLMLAAMIASARWTIRRLDVPHAIGWRLFMGVAAFGMLLIAEVAGALWLRHISAKAYLASFTTTPGFIPLVLFLLFAGMPLLVP